MTWIHGTSEDKISFFPPLHLQRQAWALGILRSENVTSVLDIGCGEGALIQALCSPSPTILEPPVLSANANPEAIAEHSFIHVKRLAGLDIDALPREDLTGKLPRWTSLDMDLWEGDLGQFNEELNVYEAMVALEVIEHLSQETLERFAPMVLGEYRPRLLLISTPNFDFNQRFDRDGKDQKGFLDPTGRTSRVFRHDDHKFEWTPTEFASYCLGIAEEFGYECTPTLIGSPTTSEPPPTSSSSHATNACLFRLSPATTRASRRTSRSFRTSSLPFLHPDDPTTRNPSQHRLVERISIPAREEAGKPAEEEGIRELLRQTMRNWKVGEVGITSVWREMAGVCGGSMRELVKALGGWGNVSPPDPLPPNFDATEWELEKKSDDAELQIRWRRKPTAGEPLLDRVLGEFPSRMDSLELRGRRRWIREGGEGEGEDETQNSVSNRS